MPFSTQQFLDVFASYNETVFPMQVVLLTLALLGIHLAANGDRASSKTVAAILSFLWLWMGAFYHFLFFSRINDAAWVFGAFFLLQSAILFFAGVVREDLTFDRRTDRTSVVGTIVIVYALVVYPIAGMTLDRWYPYSPTFGVPCPTTIFTFALLLRGGRTVPFYILPIPFLWSLLGFAAAYSLGIWEDVGLVIAGLLGTSLLLNQSSQHKYKLPHQLDLKEN